MILRVSHDRGKCFRKFPLDTTGHFILKGLVGDFKVGSLVGLAFGVPSHANNTSEWIVHAIKFSSALDRPCELTGMCLPYWYGIYCRSQI